MADLPRVSIVMAVRNEEAHINSCLERLVAQDYPKDLLEIVIADGLSEDRTKELVTAFPNGPVAVKVVPNPEQGRSQGLNIAIKASCGDVIARIDARTIVEPTYISSCVAALERTGADNVGGVQKPIASTLGQRAIGLALSHPFGVGNAQFRLGGKSGFVDSVYLGCFRTSVFSTVGYFDEAAAVITEDSDLNQRIREAGGKVYLDSSIAAYYVPRNSLFDFWKLYFRYGGARAGSFLKHKNLTSWRQAIAPLFIAWLVGLAVAAPLSHFTIVPLFGSIATYVSVDGLVSASLALKEKDLRLFPRLFSAFACMHFAWGLGFWKRLLVPQRPGTYWGY